MNIRKIIFCASASVLLWTGAFAQNEGRRWAASTNERQYSDMLRFMGKFQDDLAGEDAFFMVQDVMMQVKAAYDEKTNPYQWMSQVSDLCMRLEAIYPASVSHPSAGSNDRYETIRRDILRLWDFPVHEVSYANSDDSPIVPTAEQSDAFTANMLRHLNIKRDEVFDFLASPRPAGDELQLIKLYSSGFVLRTKNSCMGFDIVYNYAYGDTQRIDELVEYLDVLCVTHGHGDHFDSVLAKKMLAAGKPVIMPRDLIPASSGSAKVVWTQDQDTFVDIAKGIKACAKMSQQGSDPCLLYYVDIDGWRVIHNGDNDEHGKDVFFESRDRADIIFCDFFGGWCNHMRHFLAAPDSRGISTTYITTHGNEYHHSAKGRVGYHYLYFANDAFGNTSFSFPNYVAMDNAECITFTK